MTRGFIRKDGISYTKHTDFRIQSLNVRYTEMSLLLLASHVCAGSLYFHSDVHMFQPVYVTLSKAWGLLY